MFTIDEDIQVKKIVQNSNHFLFLDCFSKKMVVSSLK